MLNFFAKELTATRFSLTAIKVLKIKLQSLVQQVVLGRFCIMD